MCGIAGIITKSPKKFDYSGFCTLGIANDVRGGDSCGIFIDGKYEYGTGNKKLFQDFFLRSPLLSSVEHSTVAMVHCRKASVGVISESTAQPVILTDEKGHVKYVLMHNGTIYNYRELAEKYIPDVDITGLTDSQVMARIFYYAGYDALSEYNGGSVFAIADYRGDKPKVLLFRGASKRTEFSKEVEEERPLYYCIDPSKKELIFSSIWIHIAALRPKHEVFSMVDNTLVEFVGGDLNIVDIYDRSKCFQSKKVQRFFAEDRFWAESVVSCYLTPDLESNTYLYAGKKCYGMLKMNRFGRILTSKDKEKKSYEVYFFLGIALRDINCFRFLAAQLKESGLSATEFYSKHKNLIRFLSIDRVYPDEGFWYIAESPTSADFFTGKFKPIGCVTTSEFVNGILCRTYYDNRDFKGLDSILPQKEDINFKAIKELCMSSTK